jgi:ParB family chromosome partitioning protein
LGKGLGALIPTDAPAGATAPDGTTAFIDVPVSAIAANRHQPRAAFDEESLGSLTDSVREVGVLQPVLLRRLADDNYELIAGERRWRAARRAGLATIPAIVREVEEISSLEHAVVENLHRQDLNPLEEAAAYQELINDFGLTQDQVARRVGKSRSSVANLLRLFQLPPSVQKAVGDGLLSAGHAKVLLSTPDRAYQELLVKKIVAEDLSVRATEKLIKERADLEGQLGDNPPTPPTGRLRPPGLLELEELLSRRLDTAVKVVLNAKRGRVTIDFANLEDLERIYRLINS